MITSSAETWRSWRGLSVTNIVPEVPPPRKPPPAVTVDMKPWTLGFLATMSAATCWWRTMSSKETPCWAWVLIMIWPTSSVGRKPLGTTVKSQPVSTTSAVNTPMAILRWASTQRRVSS
ncbi:hypothetical protein D3C72_907080 [compost metagenome]